MSEERLRLTVDEIEVNADNERIAVLIADDGGQVVIPLSLLPSGTRVGDVLSLTFERDPDETERRRKRISELQKKLFGER